MAVDWNISWKTENSKDFNIIFKEWLVDNYRPISLLLAISKVFEKVIFTQLYTYFTWNNLFYKTQ